jgi:hypothetical protein
MVASSYAGAAHALGHLQPPSLRPFFLDTAVQADLRPSGFVPGAELGRPHQGFKPLV